MSRLFSCVSFLSAACIAVLACAVARADVDNPTLPSGFGPLLYLYGADPGQDGPETVPGVSSDALDGTWDHTQGSSSWDGSAPGGTPGAFINGINDPGGAVHEVEGADDVLSIVDTGNPGTLGYNDPSNRKIYFRREGVAGLNLGPAGSIYMAARFRMDPNPLEVNLDGTTSVGYGMSAGDAGQVNLGMNGKGLTMGFESATTFRVENSVVNLPLGVVSTDFHDILATMTATASPALFDVSVWIDGVSIFSNPNTPIVGDSEIGVGGIGFGLPATGSQGAMQLDYIGIGNLVPVPEPATGAMMCLALGLVTFPYRRRRLS